MLRNSVFRTTGSSLPPESPSHHATVCRSDANASQVDDARRAPGPGRRVLGVTTRALRWQCWLASVVDSVVVNFEAGTAAYDRFMGRYSIPLASPFADFAGVVRGLRVLDVGCGPGALTSELVRRVGEAATSAVDPSESFLIAIKERYSLSDVQKSTAERLPFRDHTFDAALAQLVVHFMDEPVVGLREMARVTVDDGIVAACVWDHGSGGGPLTIFWEAAHELDVSVQDESRLAGVRQGHLGQLFREAGLKGVEEILLAISVAHPSFDDWWEPYTFGVGPAGKYVQGLDSARQARLRELCRQMLPTPPFVVTAEAWAARGVA